MKTTLIALIFCIAGQIIAQDCGEDQVEIIIDLLTDQYASETTWELLDSDGQLLLQNGELSDNTQYSDTICIAAEMCVTFTIYDSFNDGLFNDAGVQIYVDGNQVADISDFQSSATVTINCAPGQDCSSAIDVGLSTYAYKPEGEWFEFEPSINGRYTVSTCGYAACDTRIWIYDDCEDLFIGEDLEGTIFFADDGDCGVEAEVSGIMIAGKQYIIRIKSQDAACTQDSFRIVYDGPISGCTDPTACNYNPFATVDDGSCVDINDPDCPKPDLLIDVGAIKNTMYVTTVNNNDECLINEGCIKGYGTRDIIRFATVIANIGNADYFIGDPDDNPDQFEYDNCHNHNHYGGYAEYVLYDEYGQYIPIGFKNGFCVIDLNCPSQDMYQYSCDYMGITAGCIDIYSENLECQWIDITDVPDGNYTFVTRVNWDNAPDGLGRYEPDSLNNWGQVCINIDRSTGAIIVDQIEDCEPYYDCLGNIYGKAEVDCNGDCNGPALRGDLNIDGTLSDQDRLLYSEAAVEQMEASSCSDLNADGKLTVYDAAMLTDCMLFGAAHEHTDGSTSHDHCIFPAGIYNHLSYAEILISDINTDEQKITLAMRNASSDILAYQLSISGIEITGIENLIDSYTAEQVMRSVEGDMVLVMSTSNSFIPKSDEFLDFITLSYGAVEDDEVCITAVDFVNAKYEQINVDDQTVCQMIDGVSTVDVSTTDLLIYPNPFTTETTIYMDTQDEYEIHMYDYAGSEVLHETIVGDRYTISAEGLCEGVYIITLSNDEETIRAKLVLQ